MFGKTSFALVSFFHRGAGCLSGLSIMNRHAFSADSMIYYY